MINQHADAGDCCQLARNLVDAIAECVVHSAMEMARRKGIRVLRITPEIVGAMDTRKFLGLCGEFSEWYRQVNVLYRVDGDAEAMDSIIHASQHMVLRSIRSAVEWRGSQ